jgi:DNA-binding CsgD family transcriptional regulator
VAQAWQAALHAASYPPAPPASNAKVSLRGSDNKDPCAQTLKPLVQLGLTPREAEVMFWVSKGKTSSEVAVILNSTTGTVNKHLEHIFAKLHVETRTAAAAMALDALR